MDFDGLVLKILGGLTNALIGDSMGSATESMTPDEVARRYGGPVTTFYPPPEGTFAGGRRAGELTDDSSQMLAMVDAILASRGPLEIERVVEALLRWADDPEMLRRFAGPSTRKAILMLRDGHSPHDTGLPNRTQNDLRLSNGAAMKVAPVGMAHPGDLDAAIADAVTLSTPTHCTNIAFAGAAALGAAVAEAMSAHPSLLSVADAALYGAREGDRIGRERGHVVPGPSVEARLRLAVQIAAAPRRLEDASEELAAVIGAGLPIAEAVPTALGLFLAARGEPNRTVTAAVTLGDDSDTVATMCGALAGAYAGLDALDPARVDVVLRVNGLDLRPRAEALARRALDGARA